MARKYRAISLGDDTREAMFSFSFVLCWLGSGILERVATGTSTLAGGSYVLLFPISSIRCVKL